VLEGQRTYDVVVRYRDDQRADLDAIRDTPIDTRGRRPRAAQGAGDDPTDDVGPNTDHARERAAPKIVVSANVSGRDLRAWSTTSAAASSAA
jgi:Cu/Ag efflux pump CusA